MNVVRLVSDFPPFEKIQYGLGPSFYHISKEQVKLGINVHVICKKYPSEKRFEEIEGIHVRRVMTPYNIFGLYELIKLSRHINIDLVHAHATSCPSYAISKNFIYNNKTRAKYVVHVHGTLKGVMSAYSRFFTEGLNERGLKQRIGNPISILRQNVMWKRADAVIAVSKSLAKELEGLYEIPRERTHVVYNGVDLQNFYPRELRGSVLKRHGLNPKSRVIMYLGGFRPVKGPMYLIKALGEIRRKFEDIKVLFVCNPRHPLERRYAKPLLGLIRRLKVNDAIRLIENIPYREMAEYYSAADALVVPSIYDSFPKVILEAMACKTPVIASTVGGVTELIRDSETGILVNPGNPDELAEAIIKILSDTDLREKIGLKARKLVEQFTWKHSAKRTLEIYENLLPSDRI